MYYPLPPTKNSSLSIDTIHDLINGGALNRRVIIPVMDREPVTWYKNQLAGGQTMQWISFLNDVISLFFLPQCIVCHPAKCFCNVTISLQRAPYGNYDSLSTKWPQKGEFHLWLFVSFISRYGSSGKTTNSSGSQYQPYNKPKTKSTRIGGPVLGDSNNSKTSAKNTVVKHPRPTGRRMNKVHRTKNF